jgi:hypothetical protein
MARAMPMSGFLYWSRAGGKSRFEPPLVAAFVLAMLQSINSLFGLPCFVLLCFVLFYCSTILLPGCSGTIRKLPFSNEIDGEHS